MVEYTMGINTGQFDRNIAVTFRARRSKSSLLLLFSVPNIISPSCFLSSNSLATCPQSVPGKKAAERSSFVHFSRITDFTVGFST